MHTPDEQAWDRDDLWDQIAREVDEAFLENRPCGIVKVTVRDFDLPARLSNGKLYVQIPFGFLLEEIEAGVPERFRDMEIRVSIAGRATLPLAGLRRAFHRSRVAIKGVVPGGRKR